MNAQNHLPSDWLKAWRPRQRLTIKDGRPSFHNSLLCTGATHAKTIMKTHLSILLRLSGVGLLMAVLTPGWVNAQMAMDETSPWPRMRSTNGSTVTIYQPQVETWTKNSFSGRAAVELKLAGEKSEWFGVVWFAADGSVNPTNRVVNLNHFDITRVQFPDAKDGGSNALEVMRQVVPSGARTVSLDYLVTAMGFAQVTARQGEHGLKHTPPEIIWATNRTVLILIDGEPVLRPVPGGNLQRVINTPALLVKYNDKFFLAGDGHLFLADSLEGPWRLSLEPPSEVAALVPKPATAAGTPGDEQLPRIIVRTHPAELVVTGGEPNYQPVRGTSLQYVADTDSQLFYLASTREAYLLLSGRWFKAASLNGPWSYVAPHDLPDEFAKIPADSPQGVVLASVPGTPQAERALLMNSVPTTATVNRRTAKIQLEYDGEPQFKPITGTTMSYAINAPMPVILCASNYYALDNGVWFTAKAATGPWDVATELPEEIYTIPPDSPVYYATFARIYDATDDTVEVGYTPGYEGDYEDDGTVVYGTGCDYESWYGSNSYYGWGWSWGYGYTYVPWYNTWVWRDWWDHPGALRSALIENRYDRWHGGDQVTPHDRVAATAAARQALGGAANYPALYGRFQNSPRAAAMLPPANTLALNPYVRPQSAMRAGEVPRGATLLTTIRQSPGGGRDIYAATDGQVYLRKNDGWYRRQANGWNFVAAPQSVIQRAGASANNRAIPMSTAPNTRVQAVANRTPNAGANARQVDVAALERERYARSMSQNRQQNVRPAVNNNRPANVSRPGRAGGGARRR